MFTTEKLAEWVTGIRAQDIPDSVMASAKTCILDVLGAACAGQKTESASALYRMVRKIFAAGKSPIWFTDTRMTAAAAALVNAASASALDMDDGHRGAAGHPGASIIPAVFAVAHETGASGRDILAAIVIGYEIACRIGTARDFSRLPTLSTGRWCAYGSAAAVAWLYRLQAPVLAQALAIAGAQIPDLAASGYSNFMGNHVKEGIPWATMLGLVAVDLAREGFTGPLDILDHPDYFYPDRVVAEFGNAWATEQVYFKPYSSCRWSHAAIDALLAILRENHIDPDTISRITVQTFERALRLNNYPDPASLEAAQYSIPFCLGVAAINGPDALLPLETTHLHDPAIATIARRVILMVDDSLNALFPHKTPARIIVETQSGRFEKTVIDTRGDPANPMTHADLTGKFRHLTRNFLPEKRQEHILESIMVLDEKGLSNLLLLIR